MPKPAEQATPDCYVSMSEGKWRVIYQGSPICADQPTMGAVLLAAKQMNVKPADRMWDGDTGMWRPLN